MFSNYNKNASSGNIPEWASFLNEEEYAAFIQAIDKYLRNLNIKYEIVKGVIVTPGVNEFGLNKLGLLNLAQKCKLDKKENYGSIVKEHLNSMIRANKFDKDFSKIINDFDKIKQYLGVRLYDNEYVGTVGKHNTIGKDFAGDIYAMIVFDLPDSVSSIKPQQAESWNKSIDELFEIGVENIKNKYPVNISKQGLDDFSFWFVNADHFFTPNIVFDLENRKELIGSKGALIGLPHRHTALIYPIDSIDVMKALNFLLPTVYGINSEGPGSVSNNLFWYNSNEFINLPYFIEDGKIQFHPPQSFIDLLSELQ